jgi:hypothetical protein
MRWWYLFALLVIRFESDVDKAFHNLRTDVRGVLDSRYLRHFPDDVYAPRSQVPSTPAYTSPAANTYIASDGIPTTTTVVPDTSDKPPV